MSEFISEDDKAYISGLRNYEYLSVITGSCSWQSLARDITCAATHCAVLVKYLSMEFEVIQTLCWSYRIQMIEIRALSKQVLLKMYSLQQ